MTFDQEEYLENPIVRKTSALDFPIESDKYNVAVLSAQKHFVESDDQRTSLGFKP